MEMDLENLYSFIDLVFDLVFAWFDLFIYLLTTTQVSTSTMIG